MSELDDETRKVIEEGVRPLKDELRLMSARLMVTRLEVESATDSFVRRCDTVLDKLDALIDRKLAELEVDIPTKIKLD